MGGGPRQNPVGREGPPAGPTAAEDGTATKVEEGLCPITHLHPRSHGGDAVHHLLEHTPTVYAIEGIGEVQKEGPSPLRRDGSILLHPDHRARWSHSQMGLRHPAWLGSRPLSPFKVALLLVRPALGPTIIRKQCSVPPLTKPIVPSLPCWG